MQPFNKLDPEMQKNILDAAFIEFSKRGYELASTNEIIKAAGISKGKLFYHFESKQNLYQYLVQLVLNKIERFIEKIDITDKDILKRYQNMAKLQMEFFGDDQPLFMFMGSIIKNKTSYLEQDIYNQFIKLSKQMQEKKNNLDGIDHSKFIDHIPKEEVIKMISYTLKGYEEHLKEVYTYGDIDISKYQDSYIEFEKLLENIKKIYYKSEDKS